MHRPEKRKAAEDFELRRPRYQWHATTNAHKSVGRTPQERAIQQLARAPGRTPTIMMQMVALAPTVVSALRHPRGPDPRASTAALDGGATHCGVAMGRDGERAARRQGADPHRTLVKRVRNRRATHQESDGGINCCPRHAVRGGGSPLNCASSTRALSNLPKKEIKKQNRGRMDVRGSARKQNKQ